MTMRSLFFTFVALTVLLSSTVFAQPFEDDSIKRQKYDYQSDVARMRKIVVNSLYSHREVFLRELLSNANDALEKLRLTSLTERDLIDPSAPLNITIKAIKDENGKGGKIIITDTGIGMSPEELATNLGTLAKSGTSDFVSRAESGADASNLIGSFGLGFYSSFLVSDQVYVASVPPKSAKNPNPSQHVFSSTADDSAFQIFLDPRGNTLGHGTEITLVLREDAVSFLDTDRLQNLVAKHSSFSTTYPIWLFTQVQEEVPIEEAEYTKSDKSTSDGAAAAATETLQANQDGDDEGVVVEDVADGLDTDNEEPEAPKTKSVVVDRWVQLNAQPPLWMRDPKTITDDEYIAFYKAAFKEYEPPLAWHHFQGDSGTGVSFRAIIFIPSKLPDDFWNNPKANSKDIRLLVKRVFITSDLGDDGVAKWASWLKVIVDADDLPLNVSRETLQSTKFLKQMKQIIVKRLIQLLGRLATEDVEKYRDIIKTYGNALKLGAVEQTKDRSKLAGLVRWHTNQRNFTSLDDYVANRKEGQKQIFFHGSLGQPTEFIAKSIFIEKLNARGYEVFLVSDPLDDFLFQALGHWEGLQFQDASKKGLLFGDEKLTEEAEKVQEKVLRDEYEPLLKWLREETKDLVRDVIISNRLVTSPCAVVADTHGYSANMERLMNAQNTKKSTDFMHEFAKKQKFLEINPNSPLIEGLLRRVKQLPPDDEEKDVEAVSELREVTSILIDGALIRSGFDVADSHLFFSQIDRVLRRSLGVSEAAQADTKVAPAPPVDTRPIDPEDVKPRIELPDHLKGQLEVDMEEIPDDEDMYGNKLPVHDEL